MLKYVALLKVEKPADWYNFSAPGPKLFKSPAKDSYEEVKNWIENEIKKYPDARVNKCIADKKYIIYTTIISFNVEEHANTEVFLSGCGFEESY